MPSPAEEYVRVDAERAAHTISFVTDPTWRAYVITHSAGRDLCERRIDGDPARLAGLPSEHVRVGDLNGRA